MLLVWHVRYLDVADKVYKDRSLILDTKTLEPAVKAAVELSRTSRSGPRDRGILKFRSLFREGHVSDDDWHRYDGQVDHFAIADYFEDQTGEELSSKRMATTLTGNPDAIMLPAGLPSHWLEYAVAKPPPLAVDAINLSETDLQVLAMFSRDVRELTSAGFFKNSDAELTMRAGSEATLRTMASEDEIRSVVTIFRRLYMNGEPGNFLDASRVFVSALGVHPLGKLIAGIADEYKSELNNIPDFYGFSGEYRPTGKRILDVFIYTRFAHQPNDDRLRQYDECLQAVADSASKLKALFLHVLRDCSIHIANAGPYISSFYGQYCRTKGLRIGAQPLGLEHPGLGLLEKNEDRKSRLRRQKIEEVAIALWHKAGDPEGGHGAFMNIAEKQLAEAIGENTP